ncbi:UDP-N-acetylmuramoyl-L-alanine--D-glutamate ligase [Parasutterella muris]|uniref:UDP-N-acetylmuramoyl-L-alanine--D-glutamate ligase n=1 Tax=Parasutterella muris TaxID=2565572 RepID=UPI00203CD0AC|nr:UDP-N-acetylmuramoyl-L-alanine--D-glutamate ligase [Parasutterella muris]
MDTKRTAVILGVGASGKTALRFLASRGWRVCAADTRTNPPGLEELKKEIPALEYVGTDLNERLIDKTDLVVISPGLSPEYSSFAPFIRAAKDKGIEVVGEIELFARELIRLRHFRGYRPKIIAITGTNGKTTTTMLCAHIVEEAAKSVCFAGNVGPNALGELDRLLKENKLPEYWVLELSSFQLETTSSLHCDSAALLNVTEDHLDWHGSMEKYAAAKRKIFSEDTVRVLNREDPLSMLSAEGVDRSLVRTFGADEPKALGEYGISTVGVIEWLCACQDSVKPTLMIPVNALRIRGRHNAMNALAASALTAAAGIDEAAILRALRDYKGEPHRVQLMLSSSGIDYVDDSKGTNVGATAAALKGFGRGKVVIILGGDGKGQDFAPLKEAIAEHAKAAVFIGRDAAQIEKAVDTPELKKAHAKNMEEAVRLCRGFAQAGDTILLSPACASWDMFKDYADRSRQFVVAAEEIAREEGQLC